MNPIDWVWKNIPWYVKWPLTVLLLPTILTLYFISWHTKSIHAAIVPYEARRDVQIKAMDKQLDSMDKKLDILILRTK